MTAMGQRLGLRRALASLLLAFGSASCATPRQPTGEADPRPARPEPEVEAPREAPVEVGVILPQTAPASLRQYGELVRQGLDIAFADTTRTVQLVVVDDGGDATRAAQHARELEARGVVAIIGPLLAEAVDAAARARTDASLTILSPTSSDPPQGRNVYTLNAGDARGSEALARYAVTRAVGPVALLYPAGADFRAEVDRFRTALQSAGGTIAADISWQPGTTTFAGQIERLRASGARAVFVPASERDIRQLAPQLAYYGLGGIQILGSEAWASDEVLGRVEPRLLEGVVAAVPFMQTSPSVAWDEFVGRYEAAQRRTLDSPYPALGWDAARLVLNAIGDDARPSAADVSRRLGQTDAFRGATGVLSLNDGTVSRRPFLVRILNGRPESIPDIER